MDKNRISVFFVDNNTARSTKKILPLMILIRKDILERLLCFLWASTIHNDANCCFVHLFINLSGLQKKFGCTPELCYLIYFVDVHNNIIMDTSQGMNMASSANYTDSLSSSSSSSCCPVVSDGSLRPPAMDPVSESEDSSLDDSMNSRQQAKKRVSWAGIHTREYALVVGDHPMCQDGLPVSLGWQYSDGISNILLTQQQQEVPLRERQQSYVFPRRLSYEERRNRLVAVSNFTLDQIKNDEIDLVVRTLKESWDDIDGRQQQQQLGGVCGDGSEDEDANSGMDMDFDPLAGMMGLDDNMMMLGIDIDLDGDLGDITDFEWTDEAS
jgi:hypothetical protein